MAPLLQFQGFRRLVERAERRAALLEKPAGTRFFRSRASGQPEEERGNKMSVVMRNTAPAREIPTRVIARSRGQRINLIPVSLRLLGDIRLENAADMLCLDLHECGVDTTIREIRRFCKGYGSIGAGVAPCIFVLGSMESLSADELWAISQQLEPAGGIFHAWPDDCRSFADAYNALADELVNSYGALQDLDNVA